MSLARLPAREDELVGVLTSHMAKGCSPWGDVRSTEEFDYSRGRTDVIALTSDGRVVAFEAKLTRWREAVHQAYRNLCFAHESYVVLPKQVALRVEAFANEFRRRSVGLCYVEEAGIVIVLLATANEPLQPWLFRAAVKQLQEPTDERQ